MRKATLIFGLIFLMTQQSLLAGGVVRTGVRSDYVTTNYDPEVKAQEVICPFALGYDYGEFLGLSLAGAYALAKYDYPFDAEDPGRTPEKLTDVTMGASIGYDYMGFEHMVMVNLNLPTGDSTWEAKRLAADVPSEFVVGDEFGAGFGCTAIYGLAAKRNALEYSLAGSYIYSGEYDPLDNGVEDTLDMGDLVVVMVSGRYSVNERTSADLRATYAHSTVTESDGKVAFQQGEMIKLALEGGYFLRDHTRLRLMVLGDIFADNKNISDIQDPVLQESYRNGNRVTVTPMVDYQHGDVVLVTLSGSYKVVADNAGKDAYYDAGGQMLGCGMDFTYAIKRQVDVELGVGYQYIEDKDEGYDADGNKTSVIYDRLASRFGVKYYY